MQHVKVQHLGYNHPTHLASLGVHISPGPVPKAATDLPMEQNQEQPGDSRGRPVRVVTLGTWQVTVLVSASFEIAVSSFLTWLCCASHPHNLRRV